MWKFLKKTLNLLDGYKNKIGNTIIAAAAVVQFAFPEHTLAYQVGFGIGLFAKTIGIGHKVKKGEVKLPSGLKKNLSK